MSSRPKRILMATMGMEIGGAETHILELSKALKTLGHEVTVCSNGGVYVAGLEAAGITHVKIPLHKRSISTMLQSFFALRRLILRGNFDVVHAHARIPSFLCGIICKNGRRVPFCTTAHFTFETKGLAGKLTNWGTYSLAVSEDLKDYLRKNYGRRDEQMSATINGIDPIAFSPDVSGEMVRKELNIANDAPLLLHVSRLDDSPSMVAEKLIAIAPKLLEQIPNLRILIVGGGTKLEEFQKQAEKVNAQVGENLLTLTGGRTDIAKCIAACDIFVGVSRATLEAMSMEKPVVLSGHQGHGGIFAEDKMEVSQKTNFCYRGLPLPTEELLTEDILSLLAKSGVEKQALGQFGRKVILEHYSTAKMAEDALYMYEKTIPAKKILLSGYYGFDNAGDEAILKVFLESMRLETKPPVVTVLSKHPERTKRAYHCIAVHRFHPIKLLRAIKHTDVLVSGGGSLLQDKSSTRSILYYLSIIRLAKLFGKPVMVYANGIGPVSRPQNRKRVQKVLEKVDKISLREEHSKKELEEIGLMGKEIAVTADPIFLLQEVDEQTAQKAMEEAGVPKDALCIGVSVRSLRTNANFTKQMAELCDKLVEDLGLTPVFLPMHFPYDAEMSRMVLAQMKHQAYVIDKPHSPETLIALTAKMELALAMRLHTMLFAAKAEVPVIGLICDPKIAYFCEKLGQISAGDVEQFCPKQVLEQIKTLFAQKQQYKENIQVAVNAMEQAASENTRLLKELLAEI